MTVSQVAESSASRVAVLGCGYWGRNIVRNFAELGALAIVSDPDEGASSEVAAGYGVEAASLDQILNDPTVPAVAIAAPAALHHQLASLSLRAGKHVFVEKPLALQVSDAEELCHLAEERDLTLMVGHLLQYHPGFLALKHLVAEGRLGRLQYVYSNRLNLGRFRQEEDILWSFAPHDISMILSLIGGEPDNVYAIGSYHLSSGIADVTTTHLSFPGGERAHVYVSWLHPYKEQRLVLVGEEGMAVFDDSCAWPSKVKLYGHRVLWDEGVPRPVRAEVEEVPLQPEEPLRAECKHFLDCVQNRRVPRTDGREGLRVLRVLNRATMSMVSMNLSQSRGS